MSTVAQLAINQYLYPHRYAHVLSRGRFELYRHVKYIGEKIYHAATTPGSRLIVNVPPRHNKSFLISYWTPTWYLDTFPEKSVLLCSYSAELASNWGRRVRNELEGNPEVMNRLTGDSKAANRFNMAAGGGMYTAGIDGGITGFGADLMLIDDPHKSMAEAYSKRVRDQSYSWYDEAYSRLEPGASVIVLMQRMHPLDLCGYLLSNGLDEWDHICLPAIAGPNDPMGRNEGEALCPERYPVEALELTRRVVREEGWAARYQQAPKLSKQGRVYCEFADENIRTDLVLNPNLPLHLSIDFNVNPGMHMILGQHDTSNDTFTAVHEIHGARMATRDAMEAFDRLVKQLGGFVWPELHIFGDASGGNSTLGTGETCYDTVRLMLTRMGIQPLGPYTQGKFFRMKVPKSNPRIYDRVNVMNGMIKDFDGNRKYMVHPRCIRLVADMTDLMTGEDGTPDKADQTLSHASEAEGYRLHYLRPHMQDTKLPVARYGAM